METETPTATPTADAADVLVVGRSYPMRDALRPMDQHAARELLLDIRSWWLDAAEAYMRQVENGCTDAMHDVWRALAAAKHYAPKAVA